MSRAATTRKLPNAAADAPAGAHPPGPQWPHFTPPALAPDDDEADERDDSLRMHQVRGSAADLGVTVPAGVPASAFHAGKLARTPRKTAPRLDPGAVTVETGVPLVPLNRGRGGGALYVQVMDRMRPGDSVVLNMGQSARLVAVGRKNGLQLVRRKVGVDTCRVWRLADNSAATQGGAS